MAKNAKDMIKAAKQTATEPISSFAAGLAILESHPTGYTVPSIPLPAGVLPVTADLAGKAQDEVAVLEKPPVVQVAEKPLSAKPRAEPATPPATARVLAESGDAVIAPEPVNPDPVHAERIDRALDRVVDGALRKMQSVGRLSDPVFEEIEIARIDENPWNARIIYKPETSAALAQSIRSDGQLVPGIAVERNGRIVLVAGHYRLRALKAAGLESMKLMVYGGLTDRDLYLLSYKENEEHTAQTALDNALAWQRVLDKNIYESQVELATAIGKSKANISKTLKVLELDHDVLEVVKMDPAAFALVTLYELTFLQKAAGAQMAIQYANKVLDEGIGMMEIAAARAKYEAIAGKEPSRRRNELSSYHYIWAHNTRIGSIRIKPTGEIDLNVNFSSRDAADKFLDDMRERFELRAREADAEKVAEAARPKIGQQVDPLTWQPLASGVEGDGSVE